MHTDFTLLDRYANCNLFTSRSETRFVVMGAGNTLGDLFLLRCMVCLLFDFEEDSK
jgi:hypothetical protein